MNNSDNCILVQVHSSSTGIPFNTPEMSRRLDLYFPGLGGFGGYPTCFVDGLVDPWDNNMGYTVSNISNEVINRLAITTPVSLIPSASESVSKASKIQSTINYSFEVNSEETIDSDDLRFILFVVEDDIYYEALNGTTDHNHVTRDIVPDENGIPVDFTDENDLSVTIEGNVEIDQNWDQENLSLVGILQDLDTREVYQAEIISLSQLSTSDRDIISIPKKFDLNKVYPNPFNPILNIELSIANSNSASLSVFNIMGEEIDTIFKDKSYNPGEYLFSWNAENYSTGTYIFKFEHENGISIKKAVLLK